MTILHVWIVNSSIRDFLSIHWRVSNAYYGAGDYSFHCIAAVKRKEETLGSIVRIRTREMTGRRDVYLLFSVKLMDG